MAVEKQLAVWSRICSGTQVDEGLPSPSGEFPTLDVLFSSVQIQFSLLGIALLKQIFFPQRHLPTPIVEVPTRTVAWQVKTFRQNVKLVMSTFQTLPCRLSPVGWVLGQQPAERPNCIQFQQVMVVMVHSTSLKSFLNATGRSCNGCHVKHRMELRQAAATSPSLWWT